MIGECTNISVGYQNEHWHDESLDLAHALAVRNAMVDFDHTKLEYKRNPGERERKVYSSYGGYYGHGREERDEYSTWWQDQDQEPYYAKSSSRGSNFDEMVEMIRLNPDYVADMLEEYGMDAKGLREELYTRGASLHRI